MNRIKELRKQLNLSLEEFGEKIGKPKSTVFRWEKEQRRIKVEDAKVIAKVFNVSLTWLMGYEAPPPQILTTEEVSLLAMFSMLTQPEQQEVIRYISNLIRGRSKWVQYLSYYLWFYLMSLSMFYTKEDTSVS